VCAQDMMVTAMLLAGVLEKLSKSCASYYMSSEYTDQSISLSLDR
jgi:hypothetical protein